MSMTLDRYRDDLVYPIVGRIITADEYYDVHCVVEEASEWTAPKNTWNLAGYKEKCLERHMHIFEDRVI